MNAIIGFVVKHLPAIILAAIIAIIAWQFYSITEKRDKAIKDYAELKHSFEIAKSENTGRLVALKAEGVRNQAAQQAQHIADIQHIGTQYGKVINNDKAVINYRNAVISQLRQQQTANSGNGVPENDAGKLTAVDSNPNATGRNEEYWQHAYSGAQEYIHVLKEAGAVCAADYNACYTFVKNEQSRIGLEQINQ